MPLHGGKAFFYALRTADCPLDAGLIGQGCLSETDDAFSPRDQHRSRIGGFYNQLVFDLKVGGVLRFQNLEVHPLHSSVTLEAHWDAVRQAVQRAAFEGVHKGLFRLSNGEPDSAIHSISALRPI